MTEWMLEREALVRGAGFGLLFVVMAGWELVARRRSASQSRPQRWLSNLGLLAVDAVVVRILLPTAAVGAAFVVEDRGWGLFHQVDLSNVLEVILSVLALDLVVYGQHVLFHAVPWLWRVHRVHHSDQDSDFTTGVRFHPVEILLSLGIKIGAIALLGASPIAVLVFEVLLNATSMFNHGNVRLGPSVDRWLRTVLVTPDMHRVHHSVEVDEASSNFGFSLTWWDRAFRTYRAQPRAGHEQMQLGVRGLTAAAPHNLLALLLLPARGKAKPTGKPATSSRPRV